MALWLVAQCARGKAVRPVRTYALAPVADLVYAARLRLSDGGEAVQRYVGGEPHEVPRRYEGACPMFWAAELVEGVTLAVGRTDTDVPVEVVERLAEEIGKVDGQRGLEYWVLEETNHYQIVDAETPAWRTIADDIDRRLQ